jgi:hypothetical protein
MDCDFSLEYSTPEVSIDLVLYHSRYGKNVKICHFIGENKPWTYSVDPQTGHVQTDESTVHNQTFLQIWWKYFLSLIHPFLDPTLVRTFFLNVYWDFYLIMIWLNILSFSMDFGQVISNYSFEVYCFGVQASQLPKIML